MPNQMQELTERLVSGRASGCVPLVAFSGLTVHSQLSERSLLLMYSFRSTILIG